MNAALIEKYNVPVPRYTSYPTVPFWTVADDAEGWGKQLLKAQSAGKFKEGISLYIHLPFCESLCTYCGCNKRITKNHSVEGQYIKALLKEWAMYVRQSPEKMVLRELHLGGGTPTFFSPEHLKMLLEGIYGSVEIHPEFDASFEGHPNNTTEAHLKALFEMGFKRVSFGVQDMDEKVQKAIHRIQPHENVKRVTAWAREIGYESVNFDLIYGLPFQTPESVERTFKEVIQLRPDRIAFYSYAHVPWASKSQKAYDVEDLPKGSDKIALYLLGQQLLSAAGYEDVGMDHFALRGDSLWSAYEKGKLHRNFMGYTTSASDVLIGLGVSAISDVFFAYRQNEKTLEAYYERLEKDEMPVFRGIDLSESEVIRRGHILDITCKGATENIEAFISENEAFQLYKETLLLDGLILTEDNSIVVTPTGRQFLRNVAALFDEDFLRTRNASESRFSKAV